MSKKKLGKSQPKGRSVPHQRTKLLMLIKSNPKERLELESKNINNLWGDEGKTQKALIPLINGLKNMNVLSEKNKEKILLVAKAVQYKEAVIRKAGKQTGVMLLPFTNPEELIAFIETLAQNKRVKKFPSEGTNNEVRDLSEYLKNQTKRLEEKGGISDKSKENIAYIAQALQYPNDKIPQALKTTEIYKKQFPKEYFDYHLKRHAEKRQKYYENKDVEWEKRRFDSLSRLIMLNSNCSATCFEGKKILVSFNEVYNGSYNDKNKTKIAAEKVNHAQQVLSYLQDYAKAAQSEEKIAQFKSSEETKGSVKERRATILLTAASYYYKKITSSSHPPGYLEFLYEKLEKAGGDKKLVSLSSYSNDVDDIMLQAIARARKDLMKLEDALTPQNLKQSINAEKTFKAEIIEAFKTFDIKQSLVLAGEDSDKVHAEMRIIQYIIEYLKKHPKEITSKNLYIGLSKLCCISCDLVINHDNKLAFIYGDRQIVIEPTRGGHGYGYEWKVINAIKNRPELLMNFLGKNAYDAYISFSRKEKETNLKEAFGENRFKKVKPQNKEDRKGFKKLYPDDSESEPDLDTKNQDNSNSPKKIEEKVDKTTSLKPLKSREKKVYDSKKEEEEKNDRENVFNRKQDQGYHLQARDLKEIIKFKKNEGKFLRVNDCVVFPLYTPQDPNQGLIYASDCKSVKRQIEELQHGKSLVGLANHGAHWTAFKISKDTKGESSCRFMDSSKAASVSNFQVFQEKLRSMEANISDMQKVNCNKQLDKTACGVFAMENAELMANSDDDILLDKTFPSSKVEATRKLYGGIYVQQTVIDTIISLLNNIEVNRIVDFSDEEKKLRDLISPNDYGVSFPTIITHRTPAEDRDEKGEFKYDFNLDPTKIAKAEKFLNEILHLNPLVEADGDQFFVPRKYIGHESLKKLITDKNIEILNYNKNYKLKIIKVEVVEDNTFLPLSDDCRLYTDNGSELTVEDLLREETVVLKLKKSYLKNTLVHIDNEMLMNEAESMVNGSSLFGNRFKWKAELNSLPDNMSISDHTAGSKLQTSKSEEDTVPGFSAQGNKSNPKPKAVKRKREEESKEKGDSSPSKSSNTKPKSSDFMKQDTVTFSPSKSASHSAKKQRRSSFTTLRIVNKSSLKRKQARDTSSSSQEETDHPRKKFKTSLNALAAQQDDINKPIQGSRILVNLISSDETSSSSSTHLKKAERSILSDDSQPYNLKEAFAASNLNSVLLSDLDRKAVITADIDLKSVALREAGNQAGSVEFIAEGHHQQDHAMNVQALADRIESGKIGKDSVIAIERKQYGRNLSVKDAILLANVFEHNKKHPDKRLQIPSEITKDSLIYHDAILYNTARKHGVKIIGLEGKNLKINKTSPAEYNEAREEYMASIINELSGKGYKVIAHVGSSHIENLKKAVETKRVLSKVKAKFSSHQLSPQKTNIVKKNHVQALMEQRSVPSGGRGKL